MKLSTINILLLLIAFCFSNSLAALDSSAVGIITPVEKHGNLSIKNGKIVSESDETVILRGMSLYWSQWQDQYWNSDVIGWLAHDWKSNVVRAAMGVDQGGSGYLYNDDHHIELVETAVESAIDWGMYIIIDWHDHNANDHEEESAEFFAKMAKKYGHYPNVIYEIFNEPESQGWPNTIKPYSQNIVDTIRKYDPDNLIIVGTGTWSQRVDIAARNPITGTNLAYAFHFYASDYRHSQNLRNLAQTALDSGLAVFVSEFGLSDATGDGYLNMDSIKVWMDWLEEKELSWCNWSVADLSESSAALNALANTKGHWDISELSESGKYIRSSIRRLNAGILDNELPTIIDTLGVFDARANLTQSVSRGDSISDYYSQGQKQLIVTDTSFLEYNFIFPEDTTYSIGFETWVDTDVSGEIIISIDGQPKDTIDLIPSSIEVFWDTSKTSLLAIDSGFHLVRFDFNIVNESNSEYALYLGDFVNTSSIRTNTPPADNTFPTLVPPFDSKTPPMQEPWVSSLALSTQASQYDFNFKLQRNLLLIEIPDDKNWTSVEVLNIKGELLFTKKISGVQKIPIRLTSHSKYLIYLRDINGKKSTTKIFNSN